MIRIYRAIYFPVFALALLSIANAQTAATVAASTQARIGTKDEPTWWNPELPDDVQSQIAAKGRGLVSNSILEAAPAEKAREVVEQHYARVWAWHQMVDKDLDAAWGAWDEARSNLNGKEKDELKALAVMSERIDPIYAEFAPQVRVFLKAMNETIGETKTIELLDHITWSPGAKRTYNAYLEMVPEMTEEEKEVLWRRMEQARQDSLAAWSGKRVIKIFKKYKVRNEFSIDYFGYGYRKRYEAWAKSKR